MTLRRIKHGYKCFRLTPDGKLISSTGLGDVLEYNLKKRTYKKIFNGPLAVFKHLEDASSFVKDAIKQIILMVIYRPSKKKIFNYINIKIKSFTKYRYRGTGPYGTDYADWVKIIW